MHRSYLPVRWPFLVALEQRFPKTLWSLFGLAYLGLIGGTGVLGFLYYLTFSLPDLEQLEKPQYDLPTQVFDRNGELVTEFYTKRRVLIPYQEVPQVLIRALLSIEDSRFYFHYGIDFLRIGKAFVVDLIKLDFAQGASTLTQQTAKMFLLSSEKKVIRKIKELLLAVQIESRFTKEQILELYLNKAYFGHGAYGIEAAAQGYFSKSAKDLTIEEAALLAGLPQAPSRWAPTSNPENALKRRNLVLTAMADGGFLTQEELQEFKAKPIRLKIGKTEDSNETSYYMEYVRRITLDLYGMDVLYTGGLKVYTCMDLKMQIAAQNALVRGLYDHDHRAGYRGAQRNLWREVAEDSKRKGSLFSERVGLVEGEFKKLGKGVQETLNQAFAAKLISATAHNRLLLQGPVIGVVRELSAEKAVVDLGNGQKGSVYLNDHHWARPVNFTQPLAWSAGLRDLRDVLRTGDLLELILEDYPQGKEGFTLKIHQRPEADGGVFSVAPRTGEVLAMSGGLDFAGSEYNRAMQAKRQPGSAFKPIVYSLALDQGYTRVSMLDDTPLVFKDTQWRPGNYTKSFKGKVLLKSALAHSKNVPTVRLTMDLGIDKVIEQARSLGITTSLPEDFTIGLGTASVTLEELALAYGVFANGGQLVQPRFIKRIESRDGQVLLNEEKTEEKRVMSEETAFLVTATLQDVVKSGTGHRAKELERPVAAKTGTTNNYTDAWFMGYVPQLLTGVYVGFDDNRKTLGFAETGATAAEPIWLEYMGKALQTLPILPFDQPAGITMVKVVPESGLLDCEGSPNAIFEYFKAGTQPTQCHQPAEPGSPDYVDPSSLEDSYSDDEVPEISNVPVEETPAGDPNADPNANPPAAMPAPTFEAPVSSGASSVEEL